MTWFGQVASPTYGFLDVFVKLQAIAADLQTSLYAVLVTNDAVGYDDQDLQQFQAAGNGVIKRWIANQAMAPGDPSNPVTDPVPTFTIPRVADVDPSVRALREVPNCQLTFRVLGAVQSVNVAIVASF